MLFNFEKRGWVHCASRDKADKADKADKMSEEHVEHVEHVEDGCATEQAGLVLCDESTCDESTCDGPTCDESTCDGPTCDELTCDGPTCDELTCDEHTSVCAIMSSKGMCGLFWTADNARTALENVVHPDIVLVTFPVKDAELDRTNPPHTDNHVFVLMWDDVFVPFQVFQTEGEFAAASMLLKSIPVLGGPVGEHKYKVGFIDSITKGSWEFNQDGKPSGTITEYMS